MEPRTVGKKYDPGKIAQIECVPNDRLKDLDIQNQCFLLLLLYEGEAKFELSDRVLTAHAPCFVCFDETESPRLVRKKNLRCHAIYFHPKFFNINQTFERVHNRDFREASAAHDLFLMMPFTDHDRYVFPMTGEYITSSEQIFSALAKELAVQTDTYWSCRCRTYFIRLIFLLEHVYGESGEAGIPSVLDRIRDPSLREAVIYIEGHYAEDIHLDDIAKYASINHTTLTRLFKNEFGKTPMEYLWHHRITVAKKQLQFTLLPIREVALQSGFKTLQHFSRKFEAATACTPSKFRQLAFENRMAALDHYVIPENSDNTTENPGTDDEKLFGFGYDLWLYCVGAEHIDARELSTENLSCRTVPYGVDNSFAFPVCDAESVFCDFTTPKNELGGVLFIRENDRTDRAYFRMPWQTDESDAHRITVDEAYREEIIQAIRKTVAHSPVRKLYLQIRCQCRDENNMIGMLNTEQISKLIRDDKLLGNVVYVICDRDNED